MKKILVVSTPEKRARAHQRCRARFSAAHVDVWGGNLPVYSGDLWNSIDATARDIAHTWFFVDGKDITFHEDHSYGDMLSLPTFFILRDAFQAQIGIANVVDRGGYDGVYVYGSVTLPELPSDVQVIRHEAVKEKFQSSLREWTTQIKHIFFFFLHIAQGKHTRCRGASEPPAVTFLLTKVKSGAIENAIVPVYRYMAERGHDAGILGHSTGIAAGLRDRGLGVISNMESFGIQTSWRTILQHFSFTCQSFAAMRSEPRTACIDGVSVTIPVQELHTLYKEKTLSLYVHGLYATSFFRKGMVAVSATEVHPIEKYLFSVIRKQGVKTVIVQHGVTHSLIKTKVANLPSSADALCVWGEDAKAFFLNEGVPADRIHVTGNPIFDIWTPEQRAKKLISDDAHFPRSPFVLFGGQNFSYPKNKALARAVIAAVKEIRQDPAYGDFAIVVTPHPAFGKKIGDPESWYGALLQEAGFELGKNAYVVQTKEIYALMAKSRVFVTANSNLHVDALAMGVALAILNFDLVDPPMNAVRCGAALGAQNQQELVTVIRLLLQGEDDRQRQPKIVTFLRRHITYPSNAPKEISGVIESVCQ